MAASLRPGLIGLGMMGRHHARVLRALDGVELVAVADPAATRTAWPAGSPLLPVVEELIAVGIDYCVVAVPTAYHEAIGLALADAGVHALVEKPLAPDVVGAARRLAEAFEAHGLVGAVGHIERYNPALQQPAAPARGGRARRASTRWSTRRQGPFPARIADVGVVKDLATHDIDLTAVGDPAAVRSRVGARPRTRAGASTRTWSPRSGSLDDGTVTSHLVNWLSPMKERVTIVTGEKGAFVADTLTADLTFHANGTVPTEWDARRGVPRRHRGRHDPLRHRQAGAAAGRARGVPRRRARQAGRHRDDARRGSRPSPSPRPCSRPPPAAAPSRSRRPRSPS